MGHFLSRFTNNRRVNDVPTGRQARDATVRGSAPVFGGTASCWLGRECADRELSCGASLRLGHQPVTAADTGLRARCLQAGLGAFDRELAVHVGEGGYEFEGEAPGGRGGVDPR